MYFTARPLHRERREKQPYKNNALKITNMFLLIAVTNNVIFSISYPTKPGVKTLSRQLCSA